MQTYRYDHNDAPNGDERDSVIINSIIKPGGVHIGKQEVLDFKTRGFRL